MISHIEANELLDLYGDLLTGRQHEILSLYFEEDLSLSEIQENLSISKAAVHDALNKGIRAMEHYESLLGLRSRRQKLRLFLEKHPEFYDELEALL